LRALLDKLSSAPVLTHLSDEAEVVVRTDASLAGLGAVLLQGSGKEERPVAFISRSLKDGEKKWSTNDLKCLAVGWAVEKLRPYLYGRKITVKTDNMVAQTLLKRKKLTNKQARWTDVLLEHDDIRIVHCSGPSDVVANALSRIEEEEESDEGAAAWNVRNAFSGTQGENLVGELKRGPAAATWNVGNAFSGARGEGEEKGRTGHFICSLTPEITAAPSHNYGREEVALRQAADERWGAVMRSLMEHGNTGPYSPSFAIRDGLLFKRGEGAGREWRLVVPNSLRMDVVRMCHNDASAGHEGEDKTWQRVHARYVKDFVASERFRCKLCSLSIKKDP